MKIKLYLILILELQSRSGRNTHDTNQQDF